MTTFKTHLNTIATGRSLSQDEARNAFEIVMSGEATPSQIGAFLMGLRVRGETVAEITGAVRTMRAKMLPVTAPADAIDIVGTGGDGAGTYNISTCAALVTAACGVPVAKHGNRAASSKSGAADVLMALGVNLETGPDAIAACIDEAGVGFMFAPQHHAAMRHVGPTRVELGTRTIFNLLGPLSNPAGVKRQIVGVFDKAWLQPLAEVLNMLGSEHVWVVHGADGLDELTTTAATHVAELKDGKISLFEVTPEQAGLSRAGINAIKGGEAAENAAALTAVLAGKPSAYRDIVLMNCAAALVVGDKASTLEEGAAMAAEAIDSGRAAACLQKLVVVSNRPGSA